MLVRELSKAWINSVMIHRHSSKSSRDWTITKLILFYQQWQLAPFKARVARITHVPHTALIKPVHRKRYITIIKLNRRVQPPTNWISGEFVPSSSTDIRSNYQCRWCCGVVSLGTVFEVVGRTEEANLQLIDFIYVAEKEKEAAETQRKLAYGVHNTREWAVKKTWTQSAIVFRWMGSRERSIINQKQHRHNKHRHNKQK